MYDNSLVTTVLKRGEGMFKYSRKTYFAVVKAFLICSVLLLSAPLISLGAIKSADVKGNYYEFDKKNEYVIDEASSTLTTSASAFGKFEISGNYLENNADFTIIEGTLSLKYAFDPKKLSTEETEWHLIKDSTKKVNKVDLKEKINSGAIILQTSLDGKIWCTEMEWTDVFTPKTPLDKVLYTTKDIQQQNGCYYQIIVAYEVEKKTGAHKVGFVTVDDTAVKRIAEVYKFHAKDKNVGNILSAEDTPRMEFDERTKTGKNNGFSGSEIIDRDDPHYSWKLGNFTINGYTRQTKKDGKLYFLKNVGDRVVLWFTLKEDINCLNKKSTLSIADDDGAYDQYFEIPRSNFGRGTLIIQFTDYEGVKHDPIIYTNYLAAYSKTGADTRVQLFEEGDYEVSLDYEIKNNPRKVGPVDVLPSYTDYKIAFSFSIRNGNCMVYPFDVVTKDELSDKAITENGFRLDMAKSRYLTINVKKLSISTNEDGTISTDIRFNRPAKDNEQYSDEGIYEFEVKNLYTGDESTAKTIYVGTNKYLKALARTSMPVDKAIDTLNKQLLEGAEIQNDGTVMKPIVEETSYEIVSEESEPERESNIEETLELNRQSDVSVEHKEYEIKQQNDNIASRNETTAASKPQKDISSEKQDEKTSKSQQEKLDEKQKTNSSTPETTTVQTDITSAEKKLEGNNTKEHKRSNAPGVAIVIISICCALIAYWVKKGKLSVKKGNGTTTNREEPKK